MYDRKRIAKRVEPRNREALRADVDVEQWHADHIQQGLREAKAGNFVPTAEVNRVIARVRKNAVSPK